MPQIGGMDPDEPVLSLASNEFTILSLPASVPGVNVRVEDEARSADAEDDEDDEDGAARVGQTLPEEDEPAEVSSDVLVEVGLTATAEPPAPPRRVDPHANGESVEAIEAAVAGLAIKQLHHVASGHPGADVPAEALQQPPETPSDDNETPVSGSDEAGNLWHAYPKHFFILSSAGKPIYSYNSDENSLVSLTALISALVSVVQNQGDTVQHIRSGTTLIVFTLHGPLYFVAVSSVGEPATALKKQLDLLYGQLVLIVTTGISAFRLRFFLRPPIRLSIFMAFGIERTATAYEAHRFLITATAARISGTALFRMQQTSIAVKGSSLLLWHT
ncbi:hypothetical protein Vretifemale_1953 [Volvox reticuliferus]|nr:hypothetical protein Vretifemale_1953 [Volvox reticuliferus]